jgi:hypothetical protein
MALDWWADGGSGTWAQGAAGALGWVLVGLLLFVVPLSVLFSAAVRRRRFWCPGSRRDVEVEFEEVGLPGFRRAVAVRSCSVFDPPESIRCKRRCLYHEWREPWDAMPVARGGV